MTVHSATQAPRLDSFALLNEAEQLRNAEPYRRNGRNAKTLLKQPEARVVLTVIRAGTRLQHHKAAGRVTVQVISGTVRLTVENSTVEATAGQLLALDRELPHDVEALADSTFLLSVWWPVEDLHKK